MTAMVTQQMQRCKNHRTNLARVYHNCAMKVGREVVRRCADKQGNGERWLVVADMQTCHFLLPQRKLSTARQSKVRVS
jgi:hypothetical protein